MKPASRKSTRAYKYDAALSFAGQDRELAESLSRRLKQRGLSVFYDADRQASLWGKTTAEFEKVYGPQARYVIPLISKHYVQKDWTRYEFETAKREEKRRRTEFILPVRLDDSRLLGLPDDVVRLDARETSVGQIAKLFAEKCRPVRRTQSRTSQHVRVAALGLLKHDARRVLGLIATAAIPLPLAYFEKLFPKYEWRRLVGEFRRLRLMAPDSLSLRLTEAALKALHGDVEERSALNQAWIDRLMPLQLHVDTAAFLSLHLLTAKRFEEAARIAVNVAENTDLDGWNDGYVTLLSGLARRRSFAKLSRGTQVKLLNSLGTGLAKAERYREAMQCFERLRRLSRLHRNPWGFGQSLINAGVAAHSHGDEGLAQKLYANAVAHARRSKDHLLLGRALSNLAQSHEGNDLDRAEALLEESLKAKAAAHDASGLATALAVRATLAVARKDFALAVRGYDEAARAFSRLGMRHEHAMSVYNHGRALQDSGNMRAAIRLYARARRLATRYDDRNILLLSLNALGAATFEMKQYAMAQECAVALLAVAKQAKHHENELGALHMLAVSLLARGKTREAAQRFRMAVTQARQRDADEFVARCLIDSTRITAKSGIGNPDHVRLRQIATEEAAAHHYGVAARVWQMVAMLSAALGSAQDTSEAYVAAEKCLSLAGAAAPAKLDLYWKWYSWAWRVRRFDEAMKALSTLEGLAEDTDDRAQAIAAADQRGVCLQELGNYAEAEALHHRSVALAKQIGSNDQRERSLNNLGEALRRMSRDREALSAFLDSEKIARLAGRHESAISTAHNRALALEALGRSRESARLLRRCRAEAARHRLWPEYVRALEGLASSMWVQGKAPAALRLYRRAMREARNREVRELQPRIALNLSRLLAAEKQAKAGLRALEKFRPQFDQRLDAHQYFGALAELYMDVGRVQEAADTWALAKTRAEAVGATDYVSYCVSREARARAQVGRSKFSQAALRVALKTEKDPERRAHLLLRSLELFLDSKATKAAQRTFNVTLRLCTEHRLFAQKAELYMLVGNSELRGKYANKLNAYKAYVMAMMSVMESGSTDSSDLASRVMFKIVSADSPVRENEVAPLLRDIQGYLSSEAPNASEQAVRLLLWPFHLAVHLFRFRKDPSRLIAAVKTQMSPKSIDRYLKGVGADGSTTA